MYCSSPLVVYGENYAHKPFPCDHRDVGRNVDMCRDIDVGVVADGRIRTCYLCFIYTPIFTVSLILVE